MSKKPKRPKPIWVNVGPGRQKLVVGAAAEAIRKLPRHSHKFLATVSVNPKQAKEFEQAAHAAGFKNIEFDKNGRCYSNSRKEEHEYVYYRTGLIMQDGGNYETISDRRERELRPEDFHKG
jgi:hypothetical protein